ncbi:ABC transporter permease [Halothermothrix orenii]|uniref:Monosaccharide-transporting ATPase n=1 Tax=Halothermothrix orenii (strain H 168 / OCM 544 / DSM 9562) TaxID=373903 RepID=B8D162_HALOH|nr:ABC transporter permease [Halothermothrix orenii]ACL71014.1 Monosaccharide-transporting ATPase [Halothermothrix orenii H 168]
MNRVASKKRLKFLEGEFIKSYGGILLGLIIICLIFTILSPRFLNIRNIMNIILQVSIIAIAAFGMTFALIIGGIDLSVGSTIALVGTVAAFLLTQGLPFLLVLLLTLAFGAILGLFNGTMISKLHIPAFIVTVATMSIFRGIAYLITGGIPIVIQDGVFLALGNNSFLGIPIPVLVLLGLFIVTGVLLSKTKFGRHAYITGGNEEAARFAGIKVSNLKIKIYVITSLMATVSGILLASRLYSAQPNAASGYELDAIAASVLGGTSLSGGYGTIFGTLIGAIIIGVINNGMNLVSVPYFYQLIVKGLVILVAVYIDVRNKSNR